MDSHATQKESNRMFYLENNAISFDDNNPVRFRGLCAGVKFFAPGFETMRNAVFLIICIFCLSYKQSFAQSIDFESGVDRQPITTSIEGIQFTTTGGQDWIFLDKRTGEYNPDYSFDGNFSAWLGENQGSGRIDFDQGVATKVSIDYSAESGLHLEAYSEYFFASIKTKPQYGVDRTAFVVTLSTHLIMNSIQPDKGIVSV